MKDNKKLEKVLEKLNVGGNQEQFNKFKDLANNYSDKSEDEVMKELLELKEKLKGDSTDEEFNKKLKRFEMIRPFLNSDQQKKLDGVMKMLKGE
ncbi:hypothetical protein PV797_06100 [Clostridiaceae bacterium M8S5]|nr:hypothetical protein PV797_06100 [Clostridiaceae bacterium M8S5]